MKVSETFQWFIAGDLKAKDTELNKVRASFKKNNVLNLEMEASEKSLKEISQKLESRNVQLTEVSLTEPLE